MKKKVSAGLLMLGLMSASLAARADTIAYATIDYGSFGTLDLTTGAYTNSFSLPGTLAGLGVDNGKLYGALLNGSALYTINPATKTFTSVNTGITFYDFGSTLNLLYAMNASGELYSINPQTNAVVNIGNVGLGSILQDYNNLSVNSATLYFANQNTSTNQSTLYSVNTSNAHLTTIGTLTNQQYTALLATNGTLYAVSQNINTYDVAGHTESAGFAITGSGGQGAYGLAPDPVPAVPLPPSVALLLSGVSLMIFVVRRRPRRDMGLPAA